MDLFQRPAYWLALPLLVAGLTTLPGLARAEQDISLDDSSAPAATPSTSQPQANPAGAIPTATFIPAVPTATPVPAAPQPTATPIPPTPTFTPVPAQPTPTPAPKAKPAPEKAVEATGEDQEAAPQAEATPDTGLFPPDPFKALADDMKRNSKFELTFDGQYSRAFQNLTANGYGLLIRAEYKFPRFVSLGIDYDFVYYTNTNGPWNAVGSFDMLLRLIPIQVGADEYYLIGGAGLNSLPQANPDLYPGPFHLYGGVGARLSMDKDWGLDLNVVYDRYSPDVDPLGTVTARLGLSYSAGM